MEPVKTSRRHYIKNILLVFGIGSVVSIILFYAYVVIGLSGGFDGMINDLKPAPNPTNGEITTKRETAKSAISHSFEHIDADTKFTNYATSINDVCYKGQNNFEVHDGFGYQCRYKVTRFYGFDSNFRQQMVTLGDILANKESWKAEEQTLSDVMLAYYDKYYGTQLNGSIYSICDLPAPAASTKGDQNLNVKYLDNHASKLNLDLLDFMQQISSYGIFYNKQNFQNSTILYHYIMQEKPFLLAISIETNYYTN